MARAISDCRRDYISRKVRELNGPVSATIFALDLARHYPRIRIYRDRRGDLIFSGMQDARVTWRDKMFIESFYLERIGYAGDKPPYQTVWGVI